MDHLTKSFDAFFKSEAKVTVLKGGWGVGKTYFWDEYINKRINNNDLPQIAYSYISLFGKTNLSDVRKSVFHCAKPISSDSEIEKSFDKEYAKSSKLLDKVPWVREAIHKAHEKTPWLSWFSDKAQHIPFINKFSGSISTLEYGLVNNYVVCFDDMERKGGSLSVREVMSLIDELALRKECKVILIFNEGSLESNKDKDEFESYREKVVDIELLHNPSTIDNLHLVFPPDHDQIAILTEVVNELDIKNIRVIKKIKWLIDDTKIHFKDKNEVLIQEFLIHAILLSWSYYVRDKSLPYESLKEQLNENSWMSFFGDEDQDKSPGEIRYRSIATNLKLSLSDFDKHICYYLENGYIDEKGLSGAIKSLSENIEVNLASQRLRAAWVIYSGSFDDNLTDFIAAIKAVIENDIGRLGLSDFSSAINILDEFDVDISEYIKNYITIHKDSLKEIDPHDSWEIEKIKTKVFRDSIVELNQDSKNYNIDEVAERIAINRGWNQDDIDFLASLTQKDFYDWMKSNPDNLTKKARSGLLTFRNVHASNENDQEKYSKINGNVIGALKDIASENEFNRRRIKYIYEIE